MAKKKDTTEKVKVTKKKEVAKKKEVIGYIVTKDGKKYEVIGENGKYWICKNTQFRKLNVVFEERKECE